MPAPLSNDLRERIVRAVRGGMSRNAAAKHYQVAISTVVRLMQRFEETMDFRPKPPCVFHGYKLSPHREVVEKMLAEKSDLTLKEMQGKLQEKGIVVSHMGIARFLKHLGISFKKNDTRQRAGQI